MLLGVLAAAPSAHGFGFTPFAFGGASDTNARVRVAVGDLNGDNRPDIAATRNASVLVLLKDAVGGGYTSHTITIATYANDVAVGDLDKDGDRDLAVVSAAPQKLTILRNDGAGTAFTPTVLDTAFPAAVEIADMAGDSGAELVTAGLDLRVWTKDATGPGFTATAVAGNVSGQDVLIADFDKNGRRDIASPVAESDEVVVAYQESNGSYTSQRVPAGDEPTRLGVGDFNGDSHLDLATANYWEGAVSLLHKDGFARTFTRTQRPDVHQPEGIAVSDLNGDGRADFVSASGSARLTPYIKDPTGTGFTPGPAESFAGYDGIEAADLNGDGVPDIVGGGFGVVFVAHGDNAAPVTVDDVSTTYRTSAPQVTLRAGDVGSHVVQTRYVIVTDPASTAEPTTVYDPNAKPTLQDGERIRYASTDAVGHVEAAHTSAAARVLPATNHFARTTAGRANGHPVTLASGDLNLDGRLDFVTANANGFLTLMRSDVATGRYTVTNTFPGFGTPTAVAIGDLDANGRPDLAVTYSSGSMHNAIVHLQNTSGGFGDAVAGATGAGPKGIAIGDLNNDGRLDIATANQTANTVTILHRNSSNNGYTAATPLALAGCAPRALDIGDGDGNGYGDLAIACATTGWIYGQSASGWSPRQIPDTAAASVLMADVTGNGRDEVLFTIPASDAVRVHDDDGTTSTDVPTGDAPSAAAVADFDGNGRMDIATANRGDDSVTLLLRNADGSHTKKTAGPSGRGPSGLAAGDVTGDGRPDLATSDETDDTVSLLTAARTAASVTDDLPSSYRTAAQAVTLRATWPSLSGAGTIKYAIVTDPASTVTPAIAYDPNAKPTLQNGQRIRYAATDGEGLAGPARTSRAAVVLEHATNTYRGGVAGPTGDAPGSVAAADLNGDDRADLVVGGADRVTILHKDASGQTFTPTTLNTGTRAYAVAVGDLNGDGRPDIATANIDTSSVGLFLKDAVGPGYTASTITTPGAPWDVAIGDLDGDGRADIVTADFGSDRVTTLRKDAGSGYTVANSPTFGDGPLSVAIGDLNGDGRVDIAAANANADTVAVITQSETGAFVTAFPVGVGDFPIDIAIGDLDGDGRADLAAATAGQYGGATLLHRNAGNTGFDANDVPVTGTGTPALALADVSGDGRLDIALADVAGDRTHVLVKNATGSAYSLTEGGATGRDPTSLVAADFDGDGRPDLATADSLDDTATVLYGRFLPAAQTAVSCAPGTLLVGVATTCTATVAPADATRPTGTVTFSGADGTFGSPDTCALPADGPISCAVTFTPTGSAGVRTITAAYGGDVDNGADSAETVVTAMKRAATTTVSCVPASVAIQTATTCSASVADASTGTASRPGGTVDFTGAGGTFGSSGSCTLPGSGDNTCSVTFTPTGPVGTARTVTGTYGGDGAHDSDAGEAEVGVTKQGSTTTTSCSPASAVLGTETTCTATVAAAGPRPGGTITFSGGGTFGGGATCILPATGLNRCSVTFTPTGAAAQKTVTGSYGGDASTTASSGDGTVSATKRQSSTTVECAPASVTVGSAATCTATVSDTSAGTATRPGGTVSFTGGGSCTLPATGDNRCGVSITPSQAGGHSVVAGYGGDDAHAASEGGGTVTATAPAPTGGGNTNTGGGSTSTGGGSTNTGGGTTNTGGGTTNTGGGTAWTPYVPPGTYGPGGPGGPVPGPTGAPGAGTSDGDGEGEGRGGAAGAPASVTARSAKMDAKGFVPLTIRCALPAGQTCTGTVAFATGRTAARAAQSQRVKIAGGKTAKVKVKLPAAIRRKLRKKGSRVRVTVVITIAGARRTQTLAIRR